MLGLVSIVQGFQKCDEVGFVLRRHGRRLAGMAVEGRIADIDIGVIPHRNVVVLLGLSISAERIDLLRLCRGIVEIHHLLQGPEYAIVEERGGVRRVRRVGVLNIPQNAFWSATFLRMGPRTPRSK